MFNPTPRFICPLSQAWERQEQARGKLAKAALPGNKTALFDALATAGIVTVTVVFDGAGDSGQIEFIEPRGPGDVEVALPDVEVLYSRPYDDGSGIKTESRRLEQMIEMLCYDLLGETHSGWPNNDGAYGTFIFDVTQRTIALDFNERFTESENFQHAF